MYKETAQDFLEDNLGRRLTLLELNRMKYILLENEDLDQIKMDMMYIAGNDAIDNSNNRWEYVDAEYRKGVDHLNHLNCKE